MRSSLSSRPHGRLGRLIVVAAGLVLAAASAPVAATSAHADANVQIADSADPVNAGTSYTYTITMPNSVGDISIDYNVFVHLTGAAATVTGYEILDNGGDSCTLNGADATCPIHSMNFNGVDAAIVLTVLPTATGTVTADVTAEYDNPISFYGSDSEDTTITAAGADLGVSVADSADPVNLGATFTDTLTVTNNGPGSASGVTATLALSGASAGIVSATPSQGSCTVTSPVSCSLGSLADSASATVAVTISPAATGTVTATATVGGDQSDPTSGNDSGAENTTVTNGLGCTITGTNDFDILNGTTGDDVICALAANDVIDGGNGNDTIYAGPGFDVVVGGNGADTIYGEDGNDDLSAGGGDDTVNGGPGDDHLGGGAGDDVLFDHDGAEIANGNAGDDHIDVQDGVADDEVNGGSGTNTCLVDAGDTTLNC